MSTELCRLCLGNHDLRDIFLYTDESESVTTVLATTTGLRIEPNDGFPQRICSECSHAVEQANKLRNQAQISETKLIELGYQRKNLENNSTIIEANDDSIEVESILEDLPNDCFDFDGFKVEVELDRITQGGDVDDEQKSEATAELKQPLNKTSRKEKRKLYLSLVEGEYRPNAPVQCKICKVTVSKWACFTNHVKKHLGFKFVCEFCGKSFISSHQLLRHCRSFHGLQRELQCPHCDYLALDSAQLKVHSRRVHTGERPYVCATCGNSYHSRKCLVQHCETHREGATVQCEQCPLMFKSRRHLAKHRYSTHTNKRKIRRQQKKKNGPITTDIDPQGSS